MAEETWNLYINVLKSLDLIYFGNVGLVRSAGNSQTANNVYCIEKSELKLALTQSEFFYNTNGYTVKGSKVSAETKKINGLNGKIKQQQNLGQDTSKLELKLIKLENRRKPNKSV